MHAVQSFQLCGFEEPVSTSSIMLASGTGQWWAVTPRAVQCSAPALKAYPCWAPDQTYA